MLNLFDNLDTPEQLRSLLNDIDSIDDKFVMDNVIKIFSQKLSNGSLTAEQATEIKNALFKRQAELEEEIRQRRINSNKTIKLSRNNTSVSNRVGSASIVFLVTNIAITTVMYTLLFISHFLNN